MIVWRIEDDTGHGPWRGKELIHQVRKGLDSTYVPTYFGFPDKSPCRMPNVWEDTEIAPNEVIRRAQDGRFAYPSLGVMFKWWGDAKEVADTTGLVIKAYEVPDVHLAENQAIFRASEAVVKAELTFEAAHRAFMHGSEELVYATD